MRSEYLDKFLATLSPYARKQLEAVLSGPETALSSEELERLVRELEASRDRVLMTPRYQSGVVSSRLYNETMKEIYIDLHRLFADCNKIGAAVYDHHRLSGSFLNLVASRLESLERKVAAFEATLPGRTPYSSAWLLDLSRLSGERELLALPGGRPVPAEFACSFADGTLTLPIAASYERTVSSYGAQLSRVIVRKRPAGALVVPGHEPDKAVDSSDTSFFGEIVLSDGPLETDGFEGRFGFPVMGACVELEVVFDFPCTVSELVLEPYGEYPVDLLLVRIYEDEAPGSPYVDVVSSLGYPAFSLDGPAVFRFPRTRASRVQIAFSQRHFTRSVYTVDKSEFLSQELWEKAAASRLDAETEAYRDLELSDEGFMPYRDAVEYWRDELLKRPGIDPDALALETVAALLPDSEAEKIQAAFKALAHYVPSGSGRSERVQVAKYEYLYGFHNIRLRDRTYRDLGVWVSPPAELRGNVAALRLSADVEHAFVELDGESMPATCVEWYVRTADDWVSILPEEEEIVGCELVELGQDGTATLRFPAQELLWVRADGRRLSGCAVSGKTLTVPSVQPGVVYTVSYVPAGDPHTLNLLADPRPVPVVESFDASSRTFALSYYPYVDYSRVNAAYLASGSFDPNGDYKPVRLSISGDLSDIGCPLNEVTMWTNPAVRNRTDYVGGLHSLIRFGEAGEFQFLQDGNIIALAEPLPAKVTVEYETLIKDLRLMAVMRRVLPRAESLTCSVRRAMLKARYFGGVDLSTTP